MKIDESTPLYFIGQCDLQFSKEGVYPSWYGYAMRDKAPFKESVDKWFVAPKFKISMMQNIFTGLNGLLNSAFIKSGSKRQKKHPVTIK